MNNNYNSMSIKLPTDMINGYLRCFGHFITDHIYPLFRIKKYFTDKGHSISTLNIICDIRFIKTFMIQFYSLLFENIVFNNNNDKDNISVGVIVGSINGSEKKKIYLARSIKGSPNIPDYLYENARKYSETNKEMMKTFRDYIWEKLNIKKTTSIDFLIINRKSNGRKWKNLNKLTDELTRHNLQFKIVNMEDHSIKDQISMIYNSKTILFPSGSSQSHLFWVDPEYSTCIECFVPGRRYINTILYSKNLGIKTIVLMDKLMYPNIEKCPLKKQKYIFYQANTVQELDSTNITDEQIQNEIECFELHLSPECSDIYDLQYRLDIDIIPKCKRIMDIINKNIKII